MKYSSSCWSLFLASHFAVVVADDILTERVLTLSVTAAKLSALAYEEDIVQFQVPGSDPPVYEHPDYEEIGFYNEEPDQAIVAKKDGRCFLAFRGTNANFADWSQNINLGDRDIYKDNNATSGEFCEGRIGFADFLETQVVAEGNVDLLECVQTCADPDDCVVLTGHSQGGATATQASILLYSLKPIIVTFGQPPAVDPDCPWIPTDQFYRFINSKQEFGEDDDIGFDPVVYSPNLISGSVQYGYPILLGEDKDAAKLLADDFIPSFFDRQNEIDAHNMAGTDWSYQSRVEALLNATSFPVSTNGFSEGVICERGYMELCDSRHCNKDYKCAFPVTELCVKESCINDEDCDGDLKCIYQGCAAADGLAEVDCPCRFDSQCRSGECDQAVLSFDWTCYDTGGNRTDDDVSAGMRVFGLPSPMIWIVVVCLSICVFP